MPIMARFTSRRERRLWATAAAAVAVIYATLGLARSLAGVLRDRDLLDAVFIAGVVLVAAAVVLIGARARPRIAEIGVAVGVAAVLVLASVRLGLPEERTHLFEYGIVAVLVYEALAERAANGQTIRLRPVVAFGITAAFGILDEVIQWILPGRVFDPADIGVNLIAAALVIVARVTVGRLRLRRA